MIPDGWDVGDVWEITCFGDPKPSYMFLFPPPRPACPTCRNELTDGRCETIGCWLFDCLIPLPDWTEHDCQVVNGCCVGCGQ